MYLVTTTIGHSIDCFVYICVLSFHKFGCTLKFEHCLLVVKTCSCCYWGSMLSPITDGSHLNSVCYINQVHKSRIFQSCVDLIITINDLSTSVSFIFHVLFTTLFSVGKS